MKRGGAFPATRRRSNWPRAFDRLWPLTEGRRLHKRRHVLPHRGFEIEIDVYDGELAGLVGRDRIPPEEEARAFDPPDWLSEDVTGDPAYLNESLATVDPLGLDPGVQPGGVISLDTGRRGTLNPSRTEGRRARGPGTAAAAAARTEAPARSRRHTLDSDAYRLLERARRHGVRRAILAQVDDAIAQLRGETGRAGGGDP